MRIAVYKQHRENGHFKHHTGVPRPKTEADAMSPVEIVPGGNETAELWFQDRWGTKYIIALDGEACKRVAELAP